MAHASDPRFLILHGLRLKGLASADAVAHLTGLDEAAVDEHLTVMAAEELTAHREGRVSGWALTRAGREAHQELAAADLHAAGVRDDVEAAYRRFLEVNTDLLGVCTDWQIRNSGGGEGDVVVNDHTDAAYDQAVIARLIGVHDRVRPVTADLRAAMDRFARYGERLRSALERVVEGDHDWFTKPTIDSYHTVWFELHEDLLATLGIERSKEMQT